MPPRLPDSLTASLRALLTHLSLFRSNQTPSELVSLHCYTKLHKVTHNVTTHLRPRCKHTLYSDHILQLSRPRTARRPKPPGPDCYNTIVVSIIVDRYESRIAIYSRIRTPNRNLTWIIDLS